MHLSSMKAALVASILALFVSGAAHAVPWNETTGVPGEGGIWQLGNAPFGNTMSGDFGANTNWPVFNTLWVRTEIDLTGFDASSATWDLGVDNGFTLYANGVQIGGGDASGFTFRWEYSGNFSASPLNAGTNVIAARLTDYGGSTAFDMQITASIIGTGLGTVLAPGHLWEYTFTDPATVVVSTPETAALGMFAVGLDGLGIAVWLRRQS